MSEHKSKALSIRQALWDFQKELLLTLKQQFDVEMGYESNPTEWFHVLTGADRFTWLRELTSLMADLDILTELEEIDEEQTKIIRSEIERLLYTDDTEQVFSKNIRPLLLNGPALLPLYTLLKANIKKVPEFKISADQAKEHRRKWHQEHLDQGRKRRM